MSLTICPNVTCCVKVVSGDKLRLSGFQASVLRQGSLQDTPKWLYLQIVYLGSEPRTSSMTGRRLG